MWTADFELKEVLQPAVMSPSDLEGDLPVLLLLNLSLLLCRLCERFFVVVLCSQGALIV